MLLFVFFILKFSIGIVLVLQPYTGNTDKLVIYDNDDDDYKSKTNRQRILENERNGFVCIKYVTTTSKIIFFFVKL